jgi:hypothetical protein
LSEAIGERFAVYECFFEVSMVENRNGIKKNSMEEQ